MQAGNPDQITSEKATLKWVVFPLPVADRQNICRLTGKVSVTSPAKECRLTGKVTFLPHQQKTPHLPKLLIPLLCVNFSVCIV
jgi:hypothetical protein